MKWRIEWLAVMIEWLAVMIECQDSQILLDKVKGYHFISD